MADAKRAWTDAGERVNALGLKLKLHYEAQRGDDGTGDQERSEVSDALRRVADSVQDAFEALGRAAKDDAVKGDVKDVGRSVADALNATFEEASAAVRKQWDKPEKHDPS